MIELTLSDGSVEYTYESQEIIDNVFYRRIYADGRMEERVKTNTGYYVRKGKADKSQESVKDPLFCPRCRQMMDNWDSSCYWKRGFCAKCDSTLNTIPFHKTSK